MENFIGDFRKSHNTYKLIVVVVVLGCVLISGGALGFAYKVYTNSLNSIWVAIDGKTYNTQHQTNSFNYQGREIELKQVVKEYHLNRYSADRYNYSDNIAQALEYCRGDVQEKVYQEYQEENMEKSVSEKGWIYQAYIDSIYLAPPTYKIGALWGRQAIKMRNRTVLRNMSYKFTLEDLQSRSDKNHLGAELSAIEVFNNKIISKDD
jgi:hypothetical protein